MRRRLALLLLSVLAACHSRGQLVLGLATDLSAKGQLDTVTLTVIRRGDTTPAIEKSWSLSGVPAQDYRLPGSFNLYADNGQEPTFDVFIDGALAGDVKVRRHSALGIVKGSDRFVRLSLAASCQTLGCPGSLTCVDNACVAVQIDPHRLPHYKKTLVTTLQCAAQTTFIDTSTHAPMPIVGSCSSDEVCNEGACLLPTSPVGGPLTGGHASIFGFDAQGAGAFASVGEIDTTRYFATATQLGDGRVLVVGGLSAFAADGTGTPVPGALVYDPSFAAFRRIANPPVAIAGHTATQLADHSVLFVGAAAGAPVAFTFDPTTEKFTSVAAPSAARMFHTASLLASGNVLLVGGLSGTTIATSAERFDPSTKTFAAVTGQPTSARYFHAASIVGADVLVSGGVATSMSGNLPTATVERYDAATDSFVDAAPLSVPRAMHTATTLVDGSVLVVGGYSDLPGSAIESAETLGSSAHVLTALPPFAAGLQQALPLGGDHILFIAGASDVDPDPSVTPTAGAYVYDGVTFTALPSPGFARAAAFAALVPTGNDTPDVLIGGGVSNDAGMTDGGVPDGSSFDLSMSDMTTLCDPLTSQGCPGKCTVAGTSTFLPGLSTVGPRCVASPTSPQTSLEPCTPGKDADSDDTCATGLVCMTDPTTGTPSCQQLCRTDDDCAGNGQRTTCALVLKGPGTDRLGVCQIACPYPDNSQFCATANELGPASLSCHFVNSVSAPGTSLHATGVCQFDGNGSAAGSTCDNTTAETSCESNAICDNGLCTEMCTTQFTALCQGACTPLYSSEPEGPGTCVFMHD